ncbi:MAG: hypothetical protein N2260_10410 [Syntrophobacterales bacterium]|nr:hypothetical protein [Syntrophobacterales bacterium]
MYHIFYGMRQRPFENSTHVDMFYLSPQHESAWTFIIDGINSREQYLLILGEYGLGKSTLALRLEQYMSQNEEFLLKVVPNPNCSYLSIMKLVASAFIPEDMLVWGDDVEKCQDSLIEYFNKTSNVKPLYVIFDDIHEVDNITVLPKILSISRITVGGVTAINWIFFAHVSFVNILRSANTQALDQRIRRRFTLEPLSLFHTKEYIYFRLYHSGARGVPIFQPEAIEMIYRYSEGIPRLINNVCDRALQIGAAMNSMVIDSNIIERVLRELIGSGSEFPNISAGVPVVSKIKESYRIGTYPNGEDAFQEGNVGIEKTLEKGPVRLVNEKVIESHKKDNKARKDDSEHLVPTRYYLYLFVAILIILALIALRVFNIL